MRRGREVRTYCRLNLVIECWMVPRAVETSEIWYSWVDSNHRPLDPQSSALTN
jgi:hypothetical protein